MPGSGSGSNDAEKSREMASTFGFRCALLGGGDGSDDPRVLLLFRVPLEDRATGDCGNEFDVDAVAEVDADVDDGSEVEFSADPG